MKGKWKSYSLRGRECAHILSPERFSLTSASTSIFQPAPCASVPRPVHSSFRQCHSSQWQHARTRIRGHRSVVPRVLHLPQAILHREIAPAPVKAGRQVPRREKATMNDAMNSHGDEPVPSPSANPKPKGFTSTQRFPCIDVS